MEACVTQGVVLLGLEPLMGSRPGRKRPPPGRRTSEMGGAPLKWGTLKPEES